MYFLITLVKPENERSKRNYPLKLRNQHSSLAKPDCSEERGREGEKKERKEEREREEDRERMGESRRERKRERKTERVR